MSPVPPSSTSLSGKNGPHKVSLACNFCRSRKRKCDGARPVCGYCRLMRNITCTFDVHSDKRKPVSRSYVSALEARIKTLEAVVRATNGAVSPEDTQGAELDDRNRETEFAPNTRTYTHNDVADGKLPEESGASLEAILDIGRLQLCVSKAENGNTMEDGHKSNFCYYGPTSGRHLAYIDDSELSLPNAYLRCDIQRSLEPRIEINLFEDEREMSLLNRFWAWQELHCTIVDRALFVESYKNGERDSEWVSSMLIDMMLAVGSQYGHQGYEDGRDMYTARAEAMVVHELGRPRMATMQAVQLMSVFQMGAGRVSVSWSLNGLVVALSNRLGLHVDSTDLVTRGIMSKSMMTMRDMALWGVFVLDRLFSIIMGVHPLHSRHSLSTRRPLGCIRNSVLPANMKLAGGEPEVLVSQHTLGPMDGSWIWFRDLCDIAETMLMEIYAFDSLGRTVMDEYNLVSKNALVIQAYIDDLPTSVNAENATRSTNLRPICLHVFINLFIIMLNRPFLGPHRTKSTTVSGKQTRTASNADQAVERQYRTLAFGHCHSAALRIIILVEYYIHSPCFTTAYDIFSACTILLLSPQDPNAIKAVRTGLGYLDTLEQNRFWVDSANDARRRILALIERWKVEPLLNELERAAPSVTPVSAPSINNANSASDILLSEPTVEWNGLSAGLDWHTLEMTEMELSPPDVRCGAFTGPDAGLFATLPSAELGAMYIGLHSQPELTQRTNSWWAMGS